MRSGLWFPLFDELADPRVAVRLAVEAEEHGWDGVFFWDHINWDGIERVGDPWIAMAAIAQATSRIAIGPMVTALPRRRPAKVARETASIDVLSGGRFILGVGSGGDQFGREFSATGDEPDLRRRAQMLDEQLEILRAAWSGERVDHHGTHYVVDGITFLPTPAHRIPIWSAGFAGKPKPLERAARVDGFVPVNLESADQLADIVGAIGELRGSLDGYDVAVEVSADDDLAAYERAGMTWWLTEFDGRTVTEDAVRGVLRDGPR